MAGGQAYTIVRVARQITNGLPITTAQCEHISYLLNDEQYDLVTFVYEGTPLGGLNRLLSGTPFSVGVRGHHQCGGCFHRGDAEPPQRPYAFH